MLVAAEAASSSVDPLVLALAGGAGGVIVGVLSVGAQLWIARGVREAENDRRTADRTAEDARHTADRLLTERNAVLARREPHYVAALAAVSDLREQMTAWRALVAQAVTAFERHEALDPVDDTGLSMDVHMLEGWVKHCVAEIPKAASRYSELRSATLVALSAARTVGSHSVRVAGQAFVDVAFTWSENVGPGVSYQMETSRISEFSRSSLAAEIRSKIDRLTEAAVPLETALRAELGLEDGQP